MGYENKTEAINKNQHRIARITQSQITPESAQRAVVVGSIAVGLAVQTLSKKGWEGVFYGTGAAVTSVFTLVSLLSVPIPLPVLCVVGIVGGVLGGVPKPARTRAYVSDRS